MRVEIYRNLNNGKLSIRADKKGVIAHADRVFLSNAEFRVNEKGRQRVIRRQSKVVHACVEGDLLYAEGLEYRDEKDVRFDLRQNTPFAEGVNRLTYNPYKHSGFFLIDEGLYAIRAKSVTIANDGKILASQVTCNQSDGSEIMLD